MYVEGNWELMNKCINFPNMDGKWDIAPMPKCPDPVSGDGRATISNGLCYATAAHGKTRDIALDVIKFFGGHHDPAPVLFPPGGDGKLHSFFHTKPSSQPSANFLAGSCYATAAHGKTRDIALDVIKFFGTEEAQDCWPL